jgi:hypothetical protein
MALKNNNNNNNLLLICFYFWCVFVTLQVMTKGELATKMECNLCSPMKTLQEIYGLDYWQGDFGEPKR